MSSRKVKILALDGGGIKGLSSLVILQRIMYRLRVKMHQPDLEPWRYFDLIGGTSTGGIIALMLGRLRMTLDECVAAYAKLGEQVFSERKGLGSEQMFDAVKLEAAIKTVIRRKLGKDHEDAPLIDPLGDDCCKTVVYTLPFVHPNLVEPKALRTYVSEHEDPTPCTIWQAARATSAAPTFFPPLPLGDPPHVTRWIDAGMKFNNPSKALRKEAGRIWGDEFGQMSFNEAVGLFLSIGTGFPRIIRLDAQTILEKISKKYRVPLKAVEVMKSITTDTETVHNDMRIDSDQRIYHRFNVEQGLQETELFEYEKMEQIEIDTVDYINAREFDLTRCITRMAELRLKEPLLSARDDQQCELFADGSYPEEEALARRLQALRITVNNQNTVTQENTVIIRKYTNTVTLTPCNILVWDFVNSCLPRLTDTGLTQAEYLIHPTLQADYLDKEGTILLESLETNVLGHAGGSQDFRPPPGCDPTIALVYKVKRQLSAFEKLRQAFVIYRQLFHAADAHWGPYSLEYLWVANRLGNLLELFGLHADALQLYIQASEGRAIKLGADDKRTKESQGRASTLISRVEASRKIED